MASALKQEVSKKLSSSTPDAQKKLASEIAAHIPAEDESRFDATLLQSMVTEHWRLAKARGKGEPALTISTTTVNNRRLTVIDVVSDDMAFLVDSVAAEINKNNCLVELLLHPIFYAQYDSSGKLTDITSRAEKGYTRRSHIHVHIKNILSDDALKALKTGLETALKDVSLCNRDWRKMLDTLRDARTELADASTGAPKKDIERYCAFLDYLHNNNFTLLGYREYEFTGTDTTLKSKTVKGKSLGLLHDDVTPAYISESHEGLPRNLQNLRKQLPAVSVSKTNRLSTVHRRVPMDAIAIKTYDKSGKVVGEKLFLGLFTSVTYSRSVGDVPYLREKVEEVMAMSDFLPGSHNSKALRHILEKYPRDELFQMDKRELFDICLSILRLQERQRIALFMRKDSFGRYVSCLVYIPRDRFGTTLRQNIVKILESELNGVCSNFYTNMDDSVFARVMFTIDISQKNPPSLDPAAIESKIQDAGRTWAERLSAVFAKQGTSDDEAARLTIKYGEAFPISYTSRYRAKNGVFDIRMMEAALRSGRLALDLYQRKDEPAHLLRLKIFSQGMPLALSDVLPILEDLDLRVISEHPFEIKPKGENQTIWIQDFALEGSLAGNTGVTDDVRLRFQQAFEKIWYKEKENDGLNRLVLKAGLNWRQVTIIRTYVRYMRQVASTYSRQYVRMAVVANPAIARLLAEMFEAVHNPAEKRDRKKLAKEFTDKINAALEKVESLDQDKILRNLLAMINATLRTNYYQTQDDGSPKSWLSIKLDSAQVPDLPEPKPYREIFVYSPRMESIHLRGDKIARGGIRWSDRHEDFRTEVLGLMKAQQVKNAVIVPMGAKGGFIVKSDIKDRKAFQLEGIECYKIMVRGMLDITDNLKGEKIISPKNVVRLDGDDPYLVVAADKGTATFSDTANALSREYGFWLDDAFASGGSAGYDHKDMGITARGAWEGIKLHFRQFGHDIQKKPFDVVGVGDMGGDVFGNGMLLSEQIQLIGAFNHVHIFCDPTPDTASSFKERKRLFDNVLGWDQYDTKKLSKGGRIYSRNEKTLQLTPEIQKRFDIAVDKIAPTDLIKAMLKARTDLLYFGGIGTYIKSSKQTDAQVSDKTNDPLRIDASDLRARVVGEGANMAMTQLARIEYAENGGRLNTDFLDNSAGVDTSDHEVNIKILLTDVMSSKSNSMDIKTRNKLLEQMTGEVAALVLRDNYQQTLAISLSETTAIADLKAHEDLMRELERTAGLKRANEGLPGRDIIEQRLRTGKGMTRPELCILLAYAKMVYTRELLATNVPDDPSMQQWVTDYFPVALQKKYTKEIARHRLRREIIAMSVANAVVNRLGPAFVMNCTIKSGAGPADIARACMITRESFGLRALWSAIEEMDGKVSADVQLRALRDVAALAEHVVTWFLSRKKGNALDIDQKVKKYASGIASLYKNMSKIAGDDMKNAIAQKKSLYKQDGLPDDLAARIAALPALSSACDIVRISIEEKTKLEKAASVYYAVGALFHLDWLREQSASLSGDSRWQQEAIHGLTNNLYTCQAGLAVHILKSAGKNGGSALDQWKKKNAAALERLESLFAELRQSGSIDLPMLVIAESHLRGLYEG